MQFLTHFLENIKNDFSRFKWLKSFIIHQFWNFCYLFLQASSINRGKFKICGSKKLFNPFNYLGNRKLYLHCVTLIPEQTSIYEVKYGYFNWVFYTLKVMPWPWASGSQYIRIRPFKWGTIHQFWSRGCKNIKGQSQQFLTFSISLC